MRGADSPGRILGVNICADCDNACGGCSWSARDPETNKIRYEPIPGWTAAVSILPPSGDAKEVRTYHITACPQFRRSVRTRRSSPEARRILRECGELKACAWCGKDLETTNTTKRYCSEVCRKAADDAVKLRKAKKAEPPEKIPTGKGCRGCPVIGTNPKTGEERHFPSMAVAARTIGGSDSRISYAVMSGRMYRGYLWRKEYYSNGCTDDE